MEIGNAYSELNDPVELDFAAEGPESAALQIGRLNEQLGRLDRANAAYERALGYAPDDLVVQTGKARLLMRLGRIDEARGLTRRLLSAAREEREWEEVCSLYALSPSADALLEDLKVLAAGPNPSARVLRAVFDASREAGDVAEAERALQRADGRPICILIALGMATKLFTGYRALLPQILIEIIFGYLALLILVHLQRKFYPGQAWNETPAP